MRFSRFSYQLYAVLGEVSVTKLLRYKLLFKVSINGFVTFKIAVTSNYKEPLHLK
jgi:hypothetical protein